MPHSPRFTDYSQDDWQRRRREVLHDYAAGLPGLSSEARHRIVDQADSLASVSTSRPAATAGRLSARSAGGEPGASPNWSFLKLPE